MLSNQWLLTIGWWWQNRRRWCEMNFEWNCSHKNSFSLFKYNKKFGYKQHKQSIGQWIRHLNLRVIHLYNFLVEFLVEFCSPETHTKSHWDYSLQYFHWIRIRYVYRYWCDILVYIQTCILYKWLKRFKP